MLNRQIVKNSYFGAKYRLMIYRFLVLLALPAIFALSGCNGPIKKPVPGIAFSTDSISLIDPRCEQKTTDACSYVKMRFPVFMGKGARYLNQQVAQLLGKTSYLVLSDEKNPNDIKDIKQLAPEFFKQQQTLNPMPDKAGQVDDEHREEVNVSWYLDGFVEADTNFKKFVALVFFQQTYQGGAHGGYFTEYHLHDPAGERALTISDFLKNISDTTALKNIAQANGIWLKEKEKPSFLEDGTVPFFLNWNNFYFNKQGMVFKYQIYEIASYAEGDFDLLIPYEKLQGILKTDYLQSERQ